MTKLPSTPTSVRASQEILGKQLSCRNLELAIRALHRDGLVVIENVIDHSKLDSLNERMTEDARILQSADDASPYNYNKGNIQQDAPATRRYFDPSIFLNPIATQVTSCFLGPKPRWAFMSGNTALPPTPESPAQSQPTHSDADFDHPDCPFALVINVALVEMKPENGSTEVWLGSQECATFAAQEGRRGSRSSGVIKKSLLEKRRQERPPSQPTVPKGSIVIRDLRLWHGGKPNLTDEIRVMLAMIHFAPWYRNKLQIEFSEDLKPVLDQQGRDVQIQAKFVSDKEILDGYMKRGHGLEYNFDQEDRLQKTI